MLTADKTFCKNAWKQVHVCSPEAATGEHALPASSAARQHHSPSRPASVQLAPPQSSGTSSPVTRAAQAPGSPQPCQGAAASQESLQESEPESLVEISSEDDDGEDGRLLTRAQARQAAQLDQHLADSTQQREERLRRRQQLRSQASACAPGAVWFREQGLPWSGGTSPGTGRWPAQGFTWEGCSSLVCVLGTRLNFMHREDTRICGEMTLRRHRVDMRSRAGRAPLGAHLHGEREASEA